MDIERHKETISADRRMEQAWVYEKEGRADLALEELLAAEKEGCGKAECFFNIARLYCDMGMYMEAEKKLGKAAAKGMDTAELHEMLGRISFGLGRYEKALEEYGSAIGMDKSSGRLHAELGTVYEKKGDYASAVSEFKKSAEMGYRTASVCMSLAKIYFRQGKKELAEQELQKAVSEGVASGEVYNDLGRLYYHSGNYDMSEKESRRSLKANPDRADTHYDLGKVYELMKKYSAAQAEFKRAGRLGYAPADIRAKLEKNYIDIASDYCREGEFSRAAQELKKAVKSDPSNGEALYLLGKTYEKSGKLSSAIREYRKAIKLGKAGADIDRDLRIAVYLKKEQELAEKGLTGTVDKYLRYSEKTAGREKSIGMNIGKTILATENIIEKDRINNERLKEYLCNDLHCRISEDFSVKIIRTPNFDKMPGDWLNYIMLLPLGMAQIVSYLKTNKINIVQDDLNIKINHRNRFGEYKDRINGEIFYDTERISRYLDGQADEDISLIMEETEKMTEISGYKAILLSVPKGDRDYSAILFMLAYAKYIRNKYDPVIIVGGLEFEKYMSFIRKHSENIDYLITGTGEKALYRLLTALICSADMSNVPGIVFREDKKIIDGGGFSVPIKPDFEGLPMDMYGYRGQRSHMNADAEIKEILDDFNNSGVILSPLRLMNGCPYGCIFCCSSSDALNYVVKTDIFVSYYKELKEKYGITGVFFLNDTLNISKDYLNELCDNILESGLDIMWCDCARADNIDRDMLFKLRKAGCVRLVYGMETASPRLLDYIGKGICLEQLEDTIRWTDEAGIWTGLEIICGFPHERREDVELTIEFIRKNRKYINMVYYNAFDLRTRSRLLLNPERYGIENVSGADLSGHPSGNPINLTRYRYDEIGGLKWKDRISQTAGSLDYMMRETMCSDYFFPFYEVEHFLFFLYSKIKDKKDIVRIYSRTEKAISEMNRLCGHSLGAVR
ncbi:MAG: tetratricopeptide repeat protein [Elusimicrobia bacterium]|nr:tetratricopeptide repeat protein [Elusimicrobiota bacterium]